MEPEIRFCKSKDGTRLAYGVLGQGRALVHVPGFLTNLEREWQDAEARSWMERVAATRMLVRCERRGTGAGERDVRDVSAPRQAEDIGAVIDHLGADSVDFFAAYDGCGPALIYAVAHPERVSKLVLFGAFVRGLDAGTEESYDALEKLALTNWRLFRRTWAGLGFPTGPAERQRWYGELCNHGISPEVAARYIRYMRDLDVSPIAAEVQAPVLILQRHGDHYAPPAAGRVAAAALPLATFVPIDGDIGLPVAGDHSYLARVEQFLAPPPQHASSAAEQPSAFRTVLFTDLVGHTEMMRRLGDERGREVLREHERITREVLKQHGGAEVKTMGDGFMASFASVTRAMDCAIALQRAFAAREGEPLQVRVGLNAGEPIEEDGDLFGSTVIMASRICGQAGAGEILVPEPLRHLLSGKSYVYADRGEVVLKGFEDAVRLYEVRWRE